MTAVPMKERELLTLRPRAYALRQVGVALILFFAPIFAVLYWFTLPLGTWLPVIVGHAVVSVLFSLTVLSYVLTVIRVEESGLTRRLWYGRTVVIPRERIGSALRVDLHRSNSPDLRPQLFLLDHDGSLLARLHGISWSVAAMGAIVDGLDLPVTRHHEPLTLGELDRARPGLLHWYERRSAARTAED